MICNRAPLKQKEQNITKDLCWKKYDSSSLEQKGLREIIARLIGNWGNYVFNWRFHDNHD